MVRPESFGMSVRLAAVDRFECLSTLCHSLVRLSRRGGEEVCCTVSAEQTVMHRAPEGLSM